MKYGYRIRLENHGPFLDTDEPREAIADGVFLVPGMGDSLRKAVHLAVVGEGAASEEAALAEARAWADAILVASIDERWPMVVARTVGKPPLPAKVESARKDGIRLMQAGLGVAAYADDELAASWTGGFARPSNALKPDKLLASTRVMRVRLSARRPLTGTERLAMELLQSSHVEAGGRGAFLLAMEALGVLVYRARRARSNATCDLIDEFVEDVQRVRGIPPDEKAALASAIGELKRQSVVGTTKRMLLERVGLEASKTYGRLYELRAAIAHRHEEPANIAEETAVLRELVRSLALSIIERPIDDV